MKKIAIVLFLILSVTATLAQSKYILSGETNFIVNGIAVLRQTALPTFYTGHIPNDTAVIRNNKFSFSGTVSWPEQYRISIINSEANHNTEPFFVDSGYQKIIIDSNMELHSVFDFGNGISIENSRANDTYLGNFLPIFDSLNKRILAYYDKVEACYNTTDSIEQKKCALINELELAAIRMMRDSITVVYVQKNPASAITPWYLYELLGKYGYKESYAQIFSRISKYIPNTIKHGLEKMLAEEKTKTIGSRFPLADYVNATCTKKGVLNKNKYTLVEFWFTACAPCIYQFDKLKPVYTRYKKLGFEIVAISVDEQNDFKKYKSLLVKKKYKWEKILDSGGRNSLPLNIQKFPSSFLLNTKNEIVAIDISPEALEAFLRTHLKLKKH